MNPTPHASSQVAHETRKHWAPVFLIGSIVSASLWDFRVHDIRIFDALSVLLIGGFFLLSPEPIGDWWQRRRNFLFLFATIIVWAIAGYVLHWHRSSLAIIVFSLIGLHLIGHREVNEAARFYKWLAAIHIAFFLLQFTTFYVFGAFIDFHRFYGTASRISNGVGNLRGAGLFQEPNSYCVNLFILSTLAILHRPSHLFVAVAATTMMLSESLWGMGAAIVLVLLNEARTGGRLYRRALTGAALALALFGFFNVYVWGTMLSYQTVPDFYSRLANIKNDTSLRDRYLQNPASVPNCIDCESPTQEISSSTTRNHGLLARTLGAGLTTQHFIQSIPAYGFALLFQSFGLLGLIALIVGFYFAIRDLTTSHKLSVSAAILFVFTTYPLLTYVIFWIWLPSLIVFTRTREEHEVSRA